MDPKQSSWPTMAPIAVEVRQAFEKAVCFDPSAEHSHMAISFMFSAVEVTIVPF